ncbi:hypothetical protein GPECTOR_37g141 [Gonium pectorale]|uniref:Cytochrome b561 domain-containing protein n=1 Tax=Gonium pectorale TaxID=33097 RepID=A0A150GBB5_GONPE|nr:hypothetical protein GPECTOR_37g141 [Gonium pectorale]|eukprot:KXZ47136.1 hypothetical protein GPECTOR_37g141 [Gonium pectorale]
MGDDRGNVDPPVLAFQTLWVREHNRLAEELAREHPDWDDEALFQEARKWNIALQQRVCFYEYMPALGIRLSPPYAGYNASVNPSIDTFFSSVSYRYGHFEINDVILRIDDSGREVPQGHLMLMQAYFNPNVSLSAGIEPVLRGLTTNVQGMVEPRFASAVQNFLFGLPELTDDAYYFENKANGAFTDEEIALIKGTPLRTVMLRNTAIKVLPDDIWRVDPGSPWPVEAVCPADANTSADAPAAALQTVSLAGGRYSLGWKFVDVSGSEHVEFTVDELVSAGEYATFRTHGILMAIAFCILMPAAFLANRLKGAHFLRDSPQLIKGCFLAHILLNVSAVALAAAAFALPLTRARDVRYSEVPYGHGRLGVAVLALLFLQAIYPWLRPAPSPLTPLRRAWEVLHTTLGRAILVMGLVNVALGIHIINQVFNGSVRFFATLAAVPLASLALVGSVVDRLSSQSAAAAASSSSGGAAHANGGSDMGADEDVKGVFVQ